MVIEKAGVDESTLEEVKSFMYFEVLRTLIVDQFGSLDASYLESICEDLYGKILKRNIK